MGRPGLDQVTMETEDARVRLAARPGTPPETLRRLAEDEAVTVRAAVALNPTHAPASDRRLLADPDERVRALLATRLSLLLPSLDAQERREAQDHVHAMLRELADDAAARVRTVISESVRGMKAAPRELVLRLAADPVPSVSDPVLRLSPLLTDEDLLAVLATPPHPRAALAIAGRPGLAGVVADHIACHAESAAVRVLLENRSAAIQESTLDALVGRAAENPDWHEPLACRPTLSLQSVRALSRFVASQVLDLLSARPELSADVVAGLRARTEAALDDGSQAPSDATAAEKLRKLAAAGALNEADLMDAVTAGDHRLAGMILAAASGTDPSTVDRAVTLRSGKALVSLVWKAGFSMQAALCVQATLGRLNVAESLRPHLHNGFPLTADEMEWQVELLASPGL